MQDGRAGRRRAPRRRLLLACLTSLFAGLLLGLAAPASAVDAPVLTGSPDSLLTSPSATWTWTADGSADIDCWLLTDGTSTTSTAWFPCTSGTSVALEHGDGDYALVVRATVQTADGAVSAQSEPSPYVRLDTVAPAVAVTASPASPSTDRAPVWSMSVEEGSSAVCTVTGPGGAVVSSSCATGDWAADLTGQPEGEWSFAVTATDAAGNTSTATAPTAYVLDVAPAAPVVTTASSPGNDPAPAWSFALPSDSTASCTLADSAGAVLRSEPCAPGWAPSLPADGTYTVTVVLTDAAGPSEPGSAQYTYDGTAPGAPTVDGPSGRTADPALSWTFAVPAGTTARCALVTGSTAGAVEPCTSPHGSVVEDGTWALEVVLVDDAGNVSAPGRGLDVEVDTTAPPIPAFTVEPSTPTAATSSTWNWTPADATVACRIRSGADVVQDWTTCSTGGVDVSTADLPDGPVSVDLRSADDLGNTSAVVSSTVELDRTAPGAPLVTGSSGAGSTPTAQWSWAADSADTASCQFLLDGAAVGVEQPCFSGQVWDLPSDGAWAVEVRLTDLAGNRGQPGTSPVYLLDRVAPEAPVVSGPAGDGTLTAVTYTVDGEPLAAVTCRLERDGAPVQDWGPCPRTIDVTLVGDGAWRLRATLTDAAGNTSPIGSSTLYRLDTTAPALPQVSGPTGPSSTTTVTWTWTGDTTAVATCRLVRDAVVVADWQRCSTSERRTLSSDGGWLWQVRLTDAAGNVAGPVDSPLYVLDTRPPDAPSVSAPPSPGSSRTPAFVVTGEDPAQVTCRVLYRDTVLQAWQSCPRTVELDLETSPEGAYRVEARLTDAAGNRSATGTSSEYVLDTVAPAVPVVSGSEGDSSSPTPTWTWTAEAASASECSLVRSDGVVVAWYGCSSAHTPVLPSEGAWRLQVRVRDAAGNVSGTATGPEYRFDATAAQAPVLAGPASPGRTTSPTWSFSGEAGTTASCRLTGPDATSAWAACASPYAADLTGRPQGTYRLDVRLVDAAGNTSASGWDEYELDTAAPAPATVTAPASPSADPLVTWTLLVAEPGLTAVCTLVRDGTAVDGGPCAVDTAGTGWSTDLSASGDGTYRLQVVVTDAAGNSSAASGADYVHDTTPPAAVAVVAPLSPGSSRTPTWQLVTEPGASVWCQFGELRASLCGASGTYQADLVGAPDGTYALTVHAVDRAGNVGPSTTTTYSLDTEQPLAPVVAGPTPSPGRQTAPVWTWTAERNSSATCSLLQGTRVVTATPCADRISVPLPADGTYVLSVTAVDAAGNASLPGTATYTLDTTAPDLPVIVGPGSPSSIAAPVFGFDAEEGAVVECRTLSGPTYETLVVDGTGWQACPEGVLALTLTVEQTYRLDVRATDAAGNTSTVAEYVYVYDRTAPAGLTDLVLPTSPGNALRPVWSFTAPPGSTTTCRLSGPDGEVESGPCTSGFQPTAPLTVEGRYVLRIVVRDTHGNLGTNDLLYVLDTTGPDAPVVTPTGAVGRVGQVQWGWTLDTTATAQCQLEHDGRVVTTWQTCLPGVQFLGQWGDGAYVLSVRGVDRVGNAGAPGQGSYTWRSAGPAALGVSTTSPTTGGPGPVLWTFPVPADAVTVTCGVRRDGAFVAGPTACRGSYLMSLFGQRDGAYEVVVRFADTVGNTTEQVRTYVLSTFDGPSRLPSAPSVSPAPRSSSEGPGPVVARVAAEVLPLLPAGTPPVDRAPRQPLGLGDGSEGLPPAPDGLATLGMAPRPGLALAGGKLSGSAAVEAIKDVATQTIKRPELPIALLLLVLLFLLVQNRIDHRDPKLAAAGQVGDDELEFRPLRAGLSPVPRAGGAPA